MMNYSRIIKVEAHLCVLGLPNGRLCVVGECQTVAKYSTQD